MKKDLIKGIIYVSVASILFGITPLGNNYMVKSGMSPQCVIMYQCFIMTIVSFLFARYEKSDLNISSKNIIYLMIIGAIGIGLTDYTLNNAYINMPVSYVMVIHFLYPTIVLLISLIFFKEKLTYKLVLAMICCMTGVIFISNPEGDITIKGFIFAFLSALAYSSYILLNDHTKAGKNELFIKLFYGSISTFFIYMIFTLYSGTYSMPVDYKSWVVLIFISGIASLFGFYFITKGIKYIGATKSAFINMLEPIIAVFGGIIFFKEVFNIYAILGCILILFSILFICLNNNKK